jgi:hypothetical protein
MFKFNKKNLLNLEHLNEPPLLNYRSKGGNNKMRLKEKKERVRIKEIKDINGMKITYEAIKKKN